jgi:hypothetical protein
MADFEYVSASDATASTGPKPPLDLSHHFSRVTAARQQSSIKEFYKYFLIPGIGNLAGGLSFPPFPSIISDLIHDSIQASNQIQACPTLSSSPTTPSKPKSHNPSAGNLRLTIPLACRIHSPQPQSQPRTRNPTPPPQPISPSPTYQPSPTPSRKSTSQPRSSTEPHKATRPSIPSSANSRVRISTPISRMLVVQKSS